VGRQAIFDRDLRVVAYELLYRNSDENRARFTDGDAATAATMLNSYVEHGLDQIAGGLPVYINLPASFLIGSHPVPLPPEHTVIEVLEDIPVTRELVEALGAFRAKGYKIALDDFILTDATRELVPFADVIKVDILDVPPADVRSQYAALRPLCKTLLAEKLSTREEHGYLHDLGFELFQGHFLQLPIISKTQRLPHNRAALMQLLAKLYDENADMRAVEKLVASEVGLAVRLIKLASSAAMSRGAPIGSVGQAIQRIGTRQVAALVLLITIAGFDDKPLELARQALVRARMCEVLARGSQVPSDQLFTAGLLSLLDAILDRPLDELLGQLPVTQLIRDALGTAQAASPGARIVEAARGQDRGDFDRVEATGLPVDRVYMAYRDATAWADDLLRLL
jgi:EAL and modified HD-GYP domain-containing signal transduction protein